MDKSMIGWQQGSSAELELFSPGSGGGSNVFQFKYTPQFRTTIRPPITELQLGPANLDSLKDALNRLGAARRGRGVAAPPPSAPQPDALIEAKRIGQMLFELVIPPDVQADLRTENLYLEIGADEGLLEYPWEMLHDGDDFLSLKNYVGRFVNVTKRSSTLQQQRREKWADDVLQVLLITVPRPQPRHATSYEALLRAEDETKTVIDTLLPLGPCVKVTLLKDADATPSKVFDALRTARYHIVHFNGHAFFSDEPYKSSLVLWNEDMSTGILRAFFARNPPVFFFMNACETAATKSGGSEWKSSYEIFGLARGFLETGAYLLGTRWKIDDLGALAFAKTFYSKLLEGKPLGMAIRDARVACKAATSPDDLSWASYLFYGDPRLYFRKLI